MDSGLTSASVVIPVKALAWTGTWQKPDWIPYAAAWEGRDRLADGEELRSKSRIKEQKRAGKLEIEYSGEMF